MDIEPLDPEFVRERLSLPPFIAIEGVHNFRDLCFVRAGSQATIRPGLIYRSAELSGITEQGKSSLKSLGIRIIFDMRSDPEILKFHAPLPSIDGVQIISAPVFKSEDYDPIVMAKRFGLYASGKTEAFIQLYSEMLDHGGPAFATILRRIIERPNDPLVFHCTAGKDRTGVLAALILKLAGESDDLIADDYALTRVGREPARELVMHRLAQEPVFATNRDAMLNMFSCRHETMLAFLSLLQVKYGGVDAYLRNYAMLSDQEIQHLRSDISNRNLEPSL